MPGSTVVAAIRGAATPTGRRRGAEIDRALPERRAERVVPHAEDAVGRRGRRPRARDRRPGRGSPRRPSGHQIETGAEGRAVHGSAIAVGPQAPRSPLVEELRVRGAELRGDGEPAAARPVEGGERLADVDSSDLEVGEQDALGGPLAQRDDLRGDVAPGERRPRRRAAAIRAISVTICRVPASGRSLLQSRSPLRPDDQEEGLRPARLAVEEGPRSLSGSGTACTSSGDGRAPSKWWPRSASCGRGRAPRRGASATLRCASAGGAVLGGAGARPARGGGDAGLREARAGGDSRTEAAAAGPAEAVRAGGRARRRLPARRGGASTRPGAGRGRGGG